MKVSRKNMKSSGVPRLLSSVLLGAVLAVFLGCSKTSEIEDGVVAVVDGVPITEERLAYEIAAAGLPSNEVSRKETLDRLITRVAMSQHAAEAGLTTDPLVASTYEGILIARLKEDVLFPRVESATISSAEVEAYYEQHLDRFSKPARVRVAILWLNSRNQDALEADYVARLEGVREQMLATPLDIDEGFGRFSITASEHRASRFKGGLLAWYEVTDHVDPFRNEVIAIATKLAKRGEMSAPTVTTLGTFLVRLIDQEPEQVIPLKQVEERIRSELKKSRIAELESEFEASILRDSEIVMLDSQ